MRLACQLLYRFLVLGCVGIAEIAGAQNFSSYGDMGIAMGSATLGQVVPHGILNNVGRRPARALPGRSLTQGQAAQAAGQSVRLAYSPTRATEKQALDAYVARIRAKNPGVAGEVEQQFGRHGANSIYRSISGAFGLRDDDVADILTAYTVLGYLVATGAPDPSRAAVRAARDQIAAGLAADGRFASAGKRAELGEELKLLFVTMHAGWQSSRKDGSARTFGDNVAAMIAQQTGNDLRAVRLTDNGFVRG